MSLVERSPWRFHFYLNEINTLSSSIQVSYFLICRSTNGMTNILAKQGVDKVVPLWSYWVLCFVFLCWYNAFIAMLLFCICFNLALSDVVSFIKFTIIYQKKKQKPTLFKNAAAHIRLWKSCGDYMNEILPRIQHHMAISL